jgi:hypothetical protein
VVSLCKLFEAGKTEPGQSIAHSSTNEHPGAHQAKISRESDQNPEHSQFTVKELDWFSKNSYNLALKGCTDWEPRQTLRLVLACIQFIDLYPKDLEASVAIDIRLRRLFCNLLAANLFVALARSQDDIEHQVK